MPRPELERRRGPGGSPRQVPRRDRAPGRDRLRRRLRGPPHHRQRVRRPDPWSC